MTTGLVTFRAYRKFDYYRLEFMQAVEKSANAEFCARVCNRWVGCRLDLVAAVFGDFQGNLRTKHNRTLASK